MAEVSTRKPARLRVAYVGRNAALVPSVKVAWEYPIADGKSASFTQKTHLMTDLDMAQAKAKKLMENGQVDEVRVL